ncbi:nuclear transport factor 2 family protein [Nitratireductor sp. ac15]
MRLHRLQLIIAAMALTVSQSLGEENKVLAGWFDALRTADQQALSDLLSDDARIILNDIGIEQTKEEFLESIDAWEEATGNGSGIRYRVDEETNDEAVVTVCYDFPSNSVLTNERFIIREAKIKESRQTQIGESCDDF